MVVHIIQASNLSFKQNSNVTIPDLDLGPLHDNIFVLYSELYSLNFGMKKASQNVYNLKLKLVIQ